MQNRKPFVVCIDPGHPSENGVGAIGRGINELNLVWAVSKRLSTLLKKDPETYTVILTKNSLHETVSNEARAKIANEAKADLFLRIHADSGSHSGFASYYPTGQAKIGGVFGPPKSVLERTKKLALPFHQAAATRLSGHLTDLGAMPESKTFIGRKHGALTGSVYSQVPVMLVELCVVSNKHDADYAKTDQAKDDFAEALKDGIDAAIKTSK